MSGSDDLYILSNRDYKACLKLETDFPDEYAVSLAAYHIQQAIEKSLKGLILIFGETPPFTHDIAKLELRCRQLGADVPEQLEDIADTLTLWESKSRYDPYAVFSGSKYAKAKAVFEKLNTALKNELDKIIEVKE